MKRNIIVLAVALIIIVAGGLIIYSKRADAPSMPTGGAATSTGTAQGSNEPLAAGWKRYQTTDWKVDYPGEIFTSGLLASGGMVLKSTTTVTDNPSGEAGREIVHTFSIAFTKGGPVRDEVVNQAPVAASNPDFAQPVTVDGKQGYTFTMGAEGINRTITVLPLEEGSLVVTFDWIGDFLNPGRSEASQKAIYDAVMKTLRLGDLFKG